MKKSGKSKSAARDRNDHEQITAYSRTQPRALQTICELLRRLIDAALPDATSKIWHGSPVWFIGENPVVGYNTSAKTVNLLFWNGQAFDAKLIRRWLTKAKADVFDSKAFFKKLRGRK